MRIWGVMPIWFVVRPYLNGGRQVASLYCALLYPPYLSVLMVNTCLFKGGARWWGNQFGRRFPAGNKKKWFLYLKMDWSGADRTGINHRWCKVPFLVPSPSRVERVVFFAGPTVRQCVCRLFDHSILISLSSKRRCLCSRPARSRNKCVHSSPLEF